MATLARSAHMAHPARAPMDECAEPSAAPIKLIYIAGYGRSGSTLLDIALGTQPGIMGAGEVTTLARHVWPNGEYCACGARVPDCPTWQPIVAGWQDGAVAQFLRDYRRMQERTEGLVGRYRRFGDRSRAEHAERTVRLFHSMAKVTGRSILVDSSKLPGRGFALAGLAGVELFVVHLVRDGRGVAWSLMKRHARQVEQGVQRDLRPKPVLYTAARWAMINLATERLCRRLGPSHAMRVRYEDFVADPGAIIQAIVTRLNAAPGPATAAIPATFAPQHQVAGSRHRMQRSITVREDESWKTEMPRSRQILFTLACAGLLRRYGYPLRVPLVRDGALRPVAERC